MPVRHAQITDTVLDSARCEDLLSQYPKLPLRSTKYGMFRRTTNC
jgi:hypothetical protein